MPGQALQYEAPPLWGAICLLAETRPHHIFGFSGTDHYEIFVNQ